MKCRLFLAVSCGLLILLFAGAGGAADIPPADGDLVGGLWVSESVFGPALRGELTVTRKGSAAHASIANVTTDFQFGGNDIRFAFPQESGKFRGRLMEGGKEIRGFWIQPSSVTRERPNPVGSRQSFATPVVLNLSKPDEWRAMVNPLDERFTLYLKIYRSSDGLLVAAFRNHDFNSNGGASLFRVTTKGDDILFTARPDESQPEIRFTASRVADSNALRIFWPDAGQTLELQRRSPDQASNAFPRRPGETYSYSRPAQTDDAWITAGGAQLGLDEAALTRTIQKIIDSDPFARRPSLIHSVVAAYRGKLFLEEYFFGYNKDLPHDSRSAGKTFASVLLGASMYHGTSIGPQSKIYELLSAMGPFANPDKRKSLITLSHLMTHTAGLACNDNDDNSPGNEDRMQTQSAQPNWWKFTLDLPLAHDPGTRYAYCSANTNLVGAALSTANKTWLPELFEQLVARPLRYAAYHWNLMPTGEGYLGGGVFLRPRDLLKVGQTYLNGGTWNGNRIVTEPWIKESTAPRVKINPQTTGLNPNEFGDYYMEAEDALAWHLGEIHSGGRAYKAYEASGNGGQLLIVIPEIDLVVVFTGANYRQGGIWLHWPDEIIGGGIIPAIQPASAIPK